MKFLFACVPIWLLVCVALAVNSLEQEFLCPICGTHWEQRIETSGRSRGLRLDLRQLGDVTDPPTLPQCTKCRFPLFSERLIEQAKDPAKEKAFKRLRTFVLGADFQMLAAKNPSYFALALVQEMIGDARHPTPHRYLALSYLRASWQVEDREAICRRLLEKSREHYAAALAGLDADDPHRADLALLCGEVARRLGKWEAAEALFRELAASQTLQGTPRAAIPELQLKLIAQHDSAPHSLEDAVSAVSRPVASREVRFENPGEISVASNRVEAPGSLKLETAPQLPTPEMPDVLFALPEPALKLPSGPAEKPEPGLTLGLPPVAVEPLKNAAPPPLPPAIPHTAGTVPAPVKAPAPAAKPESNFSDNPD